MNNSLNTKYELFCLTNRFIRRQNRKTENKTRLMFQKCWSFQIKKYIFFFIPERETNEQKNDPLTLL